MDKGEHLSRRAKGVERYGGLSLLAAGLVLFLAGMAKSLSREAAIPRLDFALVSFGCSLMVLGVICSVGGLRKRLGILVALFVFVWATLVVLALPVAS